MKCYNNERSCGKKDVQYLSTLDPNKIHTQAFDITQSQLLYKDTVNYKDTKRPSNFQQFYGN